VILADTGIWIAHFRAGEPELQAQLSRGNVAMHAWVVAELALGSLQDRVRTLALLESLPQMRTAQLSEVRHMIELHALYSKGIGLTDAHLIASVLITPSTKLWTRDKRLGAVAAMLQVKADLP